MNLENLNLVELNAQELKKFEGGIVWAILGIYLLYEIAGNPKSSWNSFKAGYNSY